MAVRWDGALERRLRVRRSGTALDLAKVQGTLLVFIYVLLHTAGLSNGRLSTNARQRDRDFQVANTR